MPAILDLQAEHKWLDPSIKDATELLPLFAPYANEQTHFYSVDKLVNSASADSPECIAPLE
jgi:putative SOS response-associated peptidase YedK